MHREACVFPSKVDLAADKCVTQTLPEGMYRPDGRPCHLRMFILDPAVLAEERKREARQGRR